MTDEVKNVVCGGCTNHCRVLVTVKDGKVVSQEYRSKQSSTSSKFMSSLVRACPRARNAVEFLYHPDRINYPLKRVGQRGYNKWQRVTWEEALDDIAFRLADIRDKHGAEAVSICAVGEANCMEEYRARFQNLFGTPNFTSHGQVCYGMATALSFFHVGGNIQYPLLNRQVRCHMLIGRNPDQAWRNQWFTILNTLESGGKLIVLDPRPSAPAQRATVWLQLRPGTDAAVLLGMANVIINDDLYDKEFINKFSYGFDKFRARVNEYPPERVSEISGVHVDKIREAARIYATTKPGVVAHGMGIEISHNAVSAMQLRTLLPALTGNLDVPGGDWILRPHPKIVLQADIECHEAMSREQKAKMIGAREYPAYSWESYHRIAENLKKVQERPLFSYSWIASANSPLLFSSILTGKPYPIKAMIIEGANPLLTMPNNHKVYQALKKIDFSVCMDVWMTPTALLADYVLPAACYLEKPVLSEIDYFPVINLGEAAVSPLYERKPEYYLWSQLGRRLGQKEYWPWESVEDAIDYRLSPMDTTFREMLARGGFEAGPFDYLKHEKVGFGTPTGKVEFYSTILKDLGYDDPLPKYEEPPQSPVANPDLAKKYPVTLISHRDWNYFQGQGRDSIAARKKVPNPVAEINPDTAIGLNINDGDWMWIETPIGKIKATAKYVKNLLPNVVSPIMGWWFPEDPAEEPSLHGLWKSNINAIIDDSPEVIDPWFGGWVMRGVPCKVYKA